MQTVVIIPALDEERAIGAVIGAIPRDVVVEVVVVDNGSSDRTADVARAAGATVLHEPRRGYGRACLAGIAHAEARGADVIVFLDGDYSDNPAELPRLLTPIRERGCGLVIGSRRLGGCEPGAMLPQAIVGNWVATTAIRWRWGYHFTDLGPFRAVRVDALRRMRMQDTTWGWTVEMQIKAAKLGLIVEEVPVSYRPRIGQSKITGTVTGTIRASYKILLTIGRHLVTA